ncbi:MAG: hypothetical protein R3D71_07335 [Rickettsiales bacterium]
MDESNKDWAYAIALRITDELSIQNDFPEDTTMLCGVLERLFLENEWAMQKIISTGIIEEDYFEYLD